MRLSLDSRSREISSSARRPVESTKPTQVKVEDHTPDRVRLHSRKHLLMQIVGAGKVQIAGDRCDQRPSEL